MGAGDINLIAKIAPYNDGFTGMVDASQVIGASGAGGYLPSSAISGNSLQEYQLKISNSPSDGYFLQYKDTSDKLTWAETSTTDVAWSGASSFYGFSSNTSGRFAPSSLTKQRLDSIFAFSTNTNLIKSGYSYVQSADSFSHGLPGVPKSINATPSSLTENFGISCRADVSNIYVYLTAPGYRNIYWTATY